MADIEKLSFEELESRVRKSLEHAGAGLADKLISVAKSLNVPAAAAARVAETRSELPASDSGIRAAIAHTFTIVSRDTSPAPNAPPSDASFDQITPEGESEQRALLANSTAVLINGRRRLLLTDAARANLLNAVHGTPRYQQLLRETSEADTKNFPAISDDEARLPSAWLRSFLTGEHGELTRAPARELRAAVEALERLQLVDFTTPSRPSLNNARRLRGLAELLEPLRILIGQRGGWEGRPLEDRFVGREDELTQLRGFVDELGSHSASETVQRFITRSYRRAQYMFGVRDESVFFIEARGGLGKSTLVAKFMLDHALSQSRPFPFAYLDFDRAALRPRDPRALLAEVARQLTLQLDAPPPELEQLCSRLRDEIAGTSPSTTWDPFDEFRHIVREQVTHGSRPFLIVLDTMEVVQYDPEALASIINFLTSLTGLLRNEEFTELKIVAAGRADVPDLRTNPEERTEDRRLVLDALPVTAARAMADKLGEWLMPGEWQDKWSRDVAGRAADPPERREPLTLRVAVELLRDTPKGDRAALAREIGKAGEEANEFFVGRLYERRILSHIRNPDVRRLAWPGLIFRRVTPDLIRYPLAGLCGVDPALAEELFRSLANEVWMVEDHGQDTIRHRPDLRARTLPLMRRHDRQKFAEVNDAAIRYFDERRAKDPVAQAEWVYHRLLGGENSRTVDPDWTAPLAGLLTGAEEDFDRNSEQRSYLLSRTATRLLPPAQLARLLPRLALDHVARTGQQLGAFDDRRIEPILVDLAGRITEPDAAPTFEHPVRAVLLVKTGHWDVDAPFEGGSGEWATHAAFASRFRRARVHTGGADADGPSAPDHFAAASASVFNEDALPMPARTIIQDLAYARITSGDAARRIDGSLASLLQDMRPTSAPSDIAALRTAVVFGWNACRPAARLWLQSQRTGVWLQSLPCLSLAELRVLLGADKRIRTLLRSKLEIVLEEIGVAWKDFLNVVREPSTQPMRVSHPEMAKVIAPMVEALLEDESDDGLRHLREFFAARDDDWIVPLGYAAARTRSTFSTRASLLTTRMESHVAFFDRQGLLGSRRKRPWTLKDLLGVLRTADEAADLLGVSRILAETDTAGRDGSDLRRLLVHYAGWRDRIQRILNEEEGGLSPDDPPPPLPVRHTDDIQKDRWGGTEERDGRRLEARLGDVGAQDFGVDLTVRSTDGSELRGPVIFHLHDTFPRSRITIRKIHEGTSATLQEVNSYGVFTAGAQVRNRYGGWTSLETDLVGLVGLPKRFLKR